MDQIRTGITKVCRFNMHYVLVVDWFRQLIRRPLLFPTVRSTFRSRLQVARIPLLSLSYYANSIVVLDNVPPGRSVTEKPFLRANYFMFGDRTWATCAACSGANQSDNPLRLGHVVYYVHTRN